MNQTNKLSEILSELPEEAGKLYIYKGSIEFNNCNYENALKIFNQGYNENPENSLMILCIGHTQVKLMNYPNAQKAFESVGLLGDFVCLSALFGLAIIKSMNLTDVKSDNSILISVISNYAAGYFLNKDTLKSQQFACEAIKICKNKLIRAESYLHMSRASCMLELSNEAEHYYNLFKSLASGKVNYINSLVNYQFPAVKEKEKVCISLAEVLSVYPNYEPIRKTLGLLYSTKTEKKYQDAALALLGRLLFEHPEENEVKFTIKKLLPSFESTETSKFKIKALHKCLTFAYSQMMSPDGLNYADNEINFILSQLPNNTQALIGKAIIAFENEQYIDSLTINQNVLQVHERFTIAQLLMAFCYIKLQQKNEATELFQSIQEKQKCVLATLSLDSCASVSSLLPVLYNHCASICFDNQDYYYGQKLAIWSLSLTSNETLNAESCYLLACGYHSQSLYHQAFMLYYKAVQLVPQFVLAKHELEKIYRDYFDDSKSPLNCANREVRAQEVSVSLEPGQLTMLRKIIYHLDTSVLDNFNLYQIFKNPVLKSNAYKLIILGSRALAMIDQESHKDPKNISITTSAIEKVQKTIAGFCDVWINIARMCTAYEQYASAIQMYEKFLYHFDGYRQLEIYKELTIVFLKTGQFTNAETILMKAKKIAPQDPTIIYFISCMKMNTAKERMNTYQTSSMNQHEELVTICRCYVNFKKLEKVEKLAASKAYDCALLILDHLNDVEKLNLPFDY